ncbi:hypothetical protein [Actinocorallia libanotica]|uniref:Roadblock/LAMTOR2 domain-containing protein n=1 Tax=Actinocorallia libanotica TaxID=46162 RepID=A0ABP4B7K4_9ACTN
MNLTHVVSTAMKSFRQNIPDYVGAGIVDISTGMLLAVDTVDNHPREILDILAAATADLFQGRTVLQIEELWKQTRGSNDNRRYFREILVNSENLVHLFMRSKTNPDIVAAIICTQNVNIGMLFAQARVAMRELEGS